MKTKNKPAQTARRAAAGVLESRADLENHLANIARLKLYEARLAADLDAETQAARLRFGPALAAVRRELEEKTLAARAWAEAHRAEFGGRKTLELRAGVLGWHSGQPGLKPLAGWTWEGVLERLKALPRLRGYVRTKEEVNKLRLLADRQALGPEALAEAGVRVTQEESFFVEPRLEVTEVAARPERAAA